MLDAEQRIDFNFFIGCSIAILTSGLSSFGVNLQAKSLKEERVLNSLIEREEPELLLDIQEQGVLNSLIEREEPELLLDIQEQGQVSLDIQEQESLDHRIAAGSVAAGSNHHIEPTVTDTSPNNQIINSNTQVANQHTRMWLRLQWYIGFSLYMLCQLFGSVVALGFISPMILAPLGSTGLMFNIMFASVFLGTGITKYDWIGTILIVAGCSIVSVFGSRIPEPGKDINEIIKLFSGPAFIAYTSTLASVSVLLMFIIKTIEYNLGSLRDELMRASSELSFSRRSVSGSARNSTIVQSPPIAAVDSLDHATSPERRQSVRRRAQFLIETTSDIILSPSQEEPEPLEYSPEQQPILEQERQTASASSTVRFYESPTVYPNDADAHETSPLLTTTRQSGQPFTGLLRLKKGTMSSLVGILYSILGGSVASMTLLLTKSGVEVALASLFGGGGNSHGKEYTLFYIVILVLLVLTAFIQIYSLNSALKYELPVIVLPIFYTFFTCLSLSNTMVYVNAFGSTSALDLCLLFMGVGVIIAGVLLLGRKVDSEA